MAPNTRPSLRVYITTLHAVQATRATGKKTSINILPMRNPERCMGNGTPPKNPPMQLSSRVRKPKQPFRTAGDVHLPAGISAEETLFRLQPRMIRPGHSKFVQRLACCSALVARVEQKQLLRGVSGTIVALACLTVVGNAFAHFPLIEPWSIEDLQIEREAIMEAYYRLIKHKSQLEEVLNVYGKGIKRVPLPTKRPESTKKKSAKKFAQERPTANSKGIDIAVAARNAAKACMSSTPKTSTPKSTPSAKAGKPKLKKGRTKWWEQVMFACDGLGVEEDWLGARDGEYVEVLSNAFFEDLGICS